jgi:hypothetical protein
MMHGIMNKYRRFFIILMTVLAVMVMVVEFARDQTAPATLHAANDNVPALSEQRARHILYGDATGGGHLHGVGKPCKSEFPPDWTAEDIVTRVQSLAANDNVRWKRQPNGYHTSEQMVDGIRIRIVTDREGDEIITAYPVNVPRNPCD